MYIYLSHLGDAKRLLSQGSTANDYITVLIVLSSKIILIS